VKIINIFLAFGCITLGIYSIKLYATIPVTASAAVLVQAEAKLKDIGMLRTQQIPLLQSIRTKQIDLEKEKQKNYALEKKITQLTIDLNKLISQLKAGSPERKSFVDKMKATFINYEAQVKSLRSTGN
jgi:SMC interacting uncharacterized protein involved in chromosome segregation